MTQRTAAKEIKVRRQDKKFFFLSWRKFYVSLVGTPRSHTTNSECLCFNSPCIIYESEHWKWSTSSFHFWRPRRQRSRCSRSSFEPITQGTTATRANCNLLQRHTWGTLSKVLLKSNWRFILNSPPYRNSSKTTALLRIVLRRNLSLLHFSKNSQWEYFSVGGFSA